MKKFVLLPALSLALAAPAAAQLSLNVRDADIRAFIADAAQATGRTFIIDSRVNGKVTVVTDHPLSKSQYFEVFLSTLRANGLVAVPTSGGAFRIQPIDNAASQPSPVGVRSAAAVARTATELMKPRRLTSTIAGVLHDACHARIARSPPRAPGAGNVHERNSSARKNQRAKM